MEGERVQRRSKPSRFQTVPLPKSSGLGRAAALIGYGASSYVAGAVFGALLFGGLTDLWGGKRLFTLTLGIYLIATVFTGMSFNIWPFALFRFVSGLGIGGEYAAINPAVQQLIPAWRRDVFVIAGVLGITPLRPRRFLPESPRWLLVHGRIAEAGRIVCAIEAAARPR